MHCIRIVLNISKIHSLVCKAFAASRLYLRIPSTHEGRFWKAYLLKKVDSVSTDCPHQFERSFSLLKQLCIEYTCCLQLFLFNIQPKFIGCKLHLHWFLLLEKFCSLWNDTRQWKHPPVQNQKTFHPSHQNLLPTYCIQYTYNVWKPSLCLYCHLSLFF